MVVGPTKVQPRRLRSLESAVDPSVIAGISVDDVDAGSGDLTMTLSVTEGKLTVNDSVAGGVPAPDISVGVRSGDTPPAVRRQLINRPPDVLITTPESLFLMLTSLLPLLVAL